MHVLVCICSSVRQFHNMWSGPQSCYATHSFAVAYVHMGLVLSTPMGLRGTKQIGRTTGSCTSALPSLWLTPVGQVMAASCGLWRKSWVMFRMRMRGRGHHCDAQSPVCQCWPLCLVNPPCRGGGDLVPACSFFWGGTPGGGGGGG